MQVGAQDLTKKSFEGVRDYTLVSPPEFCKGTLHNMMLLIKLWNYNITTTYISVLVMLAAL